jgi:RNA polymerase sigma factor (sigma-70 family)
VRGAAIGHAEESGCHVFDRPLHLEDVNHEKSNDAKLLVASDKDATAFRALYNRYTEQINGYHRRRCHDVEAALDLTAETFAQAWCARRAFRDEAGGSAGPWLYEIARNVLLQSVRRERLEDGARQRLGMLEHADHPPAAPEESWLNGIDELLDELPADQRSALELRVLEDLPYEGVASRLSITPENARTRVHRALGALRRDHSLTTGEKR